MTPSPHQAAVLASISQWQTRLLQLDRRNAALYFPAGKRGVEITNVEFDTFLDRVDASRHGLAFTYAERIRPPDRELFELDGESGGTELPNADVDREPTLRVDPGDIDTDLPPLELQKRLAAMRKRNREWQEEQGINILFLALGFLRWTDEDQRAALSPILLAPCDLFCASPRDPFRLVRDDSDDPIVNPTLRHKLATFAAIELPDIGEEPLSQYLAAVRRQIAGRAGWSVESSIVLAPFPYSKLAMWEDLERMSGCGVTHPLVRRLAGDSDVAVPAEEVGERGVPADAERLKGAALDDLLNLRDQYTVVDADFSQLRAIEMARSGTNLVIHGPPGTGKSQTIANIIATLLAEGRRVLFVSEKTAALDVVKRRLADVGLGTFCLDLHSERGKKASVYNQLREALAERPESPSEFPIETLIARRDALNQVVRVLHEVRHPLGLSAFAIHGRLAAVRDAPQVISPVRDVQSLDGLRLRAVRDAATRIERRAEEFREHATSRWHALDVSSISPRLGDAIREDLTKIRERVREARGLGERTSEFLGIPNCDTLAALRANEPVLRHLASAPENVLRGWLDPALLDDARALADHFRRQQELRRATLADLRPFVGERSPGSECRRWREAALSVRAETPRWEHAIGDAWGYYVVAEQGVCPPRFAELAAALRRVATAATAASGLLGWKSDDSYSQAVSALEVGDRVLSIATVPESWQRSSLDSIRAEVAAGDALVQGLTTAENSLAGDFEIALADRVDEEMLVRFRADHCSFWKRLGPAYRRDMRVVRGCLRAPRKLGWRDGQRAVDLALEVARLRSRWDDASDRLQPLLGTRLMGRETEWTRVLSDLDVAASVYGSEDPKTPCFHRLLSSDEVRAELGRAGCELRAALAALHAAAAAAAVGSGVEAASGQSLARSAVEFEAFAAAGVRVAEIRRELGPCVRDPQSLDELLGVLDAAVRLRDLEEDAVRAANEHIRRLGPRYRGWDTQVDELVEALNWAAAFVVLCGNPLPTGLAEHAVGPRARAVYAEHADQTAAAVSAVDAAAASAAPRFPPVRTPWNGWDRAPFAGVQTWCDDLASHADEAGAWVDYCNATVALDEAVGSAITTALRGVTADAAVVPAAVLRHVYLAWLESVYRTTPELRFSPRDLEALRAEFRELDARFPRTARERVRAKCLAKCPSNGSGSPNRGQLGTLKHELSKKKRQLPVRKLVAAVPHLLQALKPCFMMSPLAVSQYLPRGATDDDTFSFDTVIFDEASQVFPEDAVPAMARGAQLIVVGDRKQLPPSSFFRKDDGEDSDEDPEEEETPPDNRFAGVESVLDVLVGMQGSGVDEVYLEVHYRSRHEALIRYSNHYFYEDRLLTFPSAHPAAPGLGLRSVYLADGRFDAGATRTNRVEAEKVVDLVLELMEGRPADESIGVVALSRAQADLIEQLLDERRRSDRRFDGRFSDDAHERFFVKNLENVQGDERDHVILSVGYGPTKATGVVPNRFGPVNAEGGHRRLNVAVSRARRSMTVVHSLRAEDIRSESEGARLLRRYLEYLQRGDASFEGAITSGTSGDAESPFEDAVGRALQSRGYAIQRQVGCAKYSIDIAVRSEDTDGFDLGIECDGATYHSSPSARDRDRLREEVLERLGWRIHRVWSTAWIQNPLAELARIERAIEQARSDRALGTAAVDPTPRAEANVPDRPYARLAAERVPGIEQVREVPGVSLFVPYLFATLNSYRPRADLRDEAPSRLATLVEMIVRNEGPVHVDLVVERVRDHYGIQRAGHIIRGAIEAGIDVAVNGGAASWLDAKKGHRSRGTFLQSAAPEPVIPRGPGANGFVRSIEQISDAEIEAGMLCVVRSLFGSSREDAVVATAREFGFARLGQFVERRIAAAIDRLLARGEILERVGALVVRDRADA